MGLGLFLQTEIRHSALLLMVMMQFLFKEISVVHGKILMSLVKLVMTLEQVGQSVEIQQQLLH
jgi:hypothetical protein